MSLLERLVGYLPMLLQGAVTTLWISLLAIQMGFVLGALLLARKLHEPKAASLEALLTAIMIESPQRLWLRFWPRD